MGELREGGNFTLLYLLLALAYHIKQLGWCFPHLGDWEKGMNEGKEKGREKFAGEIE